MDTKETHIWVDGCYDMVHFGHANSFRQARDLGSHLTVGVHSDAEITLHKGAPPVFKEQERYEMVRAIKWVDRVVEAAPYVTTLDTLEQHGCQYCAHGNDITLSADGTDTYQAVKDAGRYKEVERTQGVSTTALLKRMINADKKRREERDSNNNKIECGGAEDEKKDESPYTGSSKLLLTTHKLLSFRNNNDNEPPKANDKVVYVAGSFDVFHPGHLRFLEKAKQLGTYLIVGVYDDPTVQRLHGSAYPIMSLFERALSLLACRHVSDVLIGAPLEVTAELLDHLNVSVVALGKNGTSNHPSTYQNLYSEPTKRGIFEVINSGSDLTTEEIAARVAANAAAYEERNKRKENSEAQYLINGH